jgi:hypothetical protein
MFYSDLVTVSCIPDSELVLENISSIFITLEDKHAPFKQFRVKDRLNLWFSLELPVLIQRRNQAWAKAKLTDYNLSDNVLPLHKRCWPLWPNNYRPNSKLSCPTKILESLINSQLRSFLSLKCILNVHQLSFRPNCSTISVASLVLNVVLVLTVWIK